MIIKRKYLLFLFPLLLFMMAGVTSTHFLSEITTLTWGKLLVFIHLCIVVSLIIAAFFLRAQISKHTVALEETKSKHPNLVDNSLVGIYITQNHLVKFANEGMAKLFGYPSAKDMLGVRVQDLVTSQSWETVQEEVQLRISGKKESSNYRFKGLRKDGSTLDIEALGATTEYQGKSALQGVLIDVTERVRAEERFKHLSEASLEAILISEKGICLEENLAAEKLFGYSQEEAEGMVATDIFVPEDRDLVIHHILSGHNAPYRATALRKDGSTFSAEINGRIMRYEGRAVRVTSIRDITKQAQAERALSESEKRYRSIFENAVEGIFQSTLEGRFLMVNPAFAKIYGYESPEELLAEVTDIRKQLYIDENDRDKLLDTIKGSEVFFEGAEQNYRKDGSLIWTVTKARAVRDEAGKILYIEGFVEDITERKEAEEALRESEEHYRHLFNSLPYGGEIINLEGKITDCSPSTLEMLGYEKNEIIGKHITNFVDADTAKIFKQNFFKILKGESLSIEGCMIHKNGSQLHVLRAGQPIFNTDREVVGMLAMSINITERVQAEKTLKESEERLRTLINATPDIICFKDELGRWRIANDADLKLFQLEDVDYIGKTDRELSEYSDFYKEAFLACDETDEIAWQAGDLSRADEVIPTPDQGNKVYDVIKVPLFNEDGSRKALVVLGRDITNFALAQTKLNQHIQRLKTADRITSALSASLNLENLLEIILEEVKLTVKFDSASIFLIEKNGDVTIAKAIGDAEKLIGYSCPLTETLMQGINKKHQPLILEDVKKSIYYQEWDNDIPLRSWMGLPLVARDLVLGYLTLDSYTPQAFSPQDAALAESFSPHIAQAIYNARLHKELQQNFQQLETLNTVTAALSRSLALDEVLKLILEQIETAIPFDSASIFLIEEETLKVAIAEGLAPELVGQSYLLENELMKTLLQTKEPLVLSDAQKDERFESWGNTQMIRGWMGIPLIARDEVIGFLTLDSYQAESYTPEHAMIAQPLAAQAAQAIYNARLYTRVIQDSNALEKRVQERTRELQNFVSLTADREIRMAELKDVIAKLRTQLIEADQEPIADDPLRYPE